MRKHLLLALCMASAAASTTLSAADFTPPCEISCSTQEEFDAWLVEDANAATSDNTWTYNSSSKCADYEYDANFAADDWIISPSIELKAGVTYTINGSLKGNFRWNTEKYAICIGTSREASALTTVIDAQEDFNLLYFDYRGGTFTPTQNGTYYVGIHCYSEKLQGTLSFNGLKIEAVTPYPAAATITSITAAPEGKLEAYVNWTMPEKDNFNGTLTSVSGAYIYRGTYSTFTINESSLVGTYNGGTPGEECTWTDNTLTASGKYYYAVVPFNANGASTSSVTRKQSDWIGMDTGVGSIPSVTAALQAGSETKITVTWETPKGYNGGPVDLTDLKYNVIRAGSVNTTSVTVAENISGNSLIDEVNTLDQYTYTVKTVYNGTTASSGKASNAVIAGGALVPPYSENFNTGSSAKILALWTRFHADGTSKDWSVTSSALALYGGPADAWAVLPVMQLEAGVPYELSFTAKINYYNAPKDLYVYIGKEPNTENLSQTQLFKQTISSTYGSTSKVSVSVPEDGRYYIAFYCKNTGSDSRYLYVDDVNLKEVELKPAPVTNFTATAAEKGAMAAILNWINPTKTNAGTDLSEITKIEVLRGSNVIATISEGLTIGETSTYADNTIAEAGTYTYTLKPYLAESAGETTSATTSWVGADTPAAPTSVNVTVTDEGRVVAFESTGEGVNGGYVDLETLHYEVTRNGETIASDVSVSPYTDSETGLSLGKYTYGVKAVNGELSSSEVKATAVVFGEALELPYEADFTNNGDLDFWTLTGDGSSWTKMPGSYNGRLSANAAADNAWAFTPPLKLVHSNLKLTFEDERYYSDDVAQPLEVYISKSTDHTNSEHHTLIDSHNIDNYNGEEHNVDFTVYHPGTYYVAYRIPTRTGRRADIKSTKLEATTILTGVEDVVAEGDGMLMYSRTFDLIQAPEGVEVSVYNAAGVLVLRAEAVDGHVDTSALASGLYVAAATASGEKLTLKFAK